MKFGGTSMGSAERMRVAAQICTEQARKRPVLVVVSAIASSSLATEWVKGKTVEEALSIKNTDIVRELSLPPVKIHCSVLAEDAIKAALSDWKKKQGEPETAATEPASAHN